MFTTTPEAQIKGYLPVQQHAALGNAREALDINMAQAAEIPFVKQNPNPHVKLAKITKQMILDSKQKGGSTEILKNFPDSWLCTVKIFIHV